MFGIDDFFAPIIDFSNFQFSQLGDALVFGAAILLIGMVTVFAVLCILWLFLLLFKVCFHDLPKKKKVKKEILTPVVDNEGLSQSTAAEEGELIAVIAAAIAMAESDNSGRKFRVVSFRRT